MQRGSTVSACQKVIALLHMKRWSPLHMKRWLPLDPGDQWLMQRGSTVNFHMKNSKDLTYLCCMLVLKLFTLQFTIDAERINSQLSHGKFKRFNLSFLYVGIKTLYITVYNWCREDQQSLHVKRWLLLCIKRWSPLHMNRWLPLWMKRQSPLLILWELMINAEKINSQLSHGKFKRFNLFFLHVGIKTVCITVYNWHREDQQSLHVKRHLPLHVKRWSPLHMKRQLPLYVKRWLPQLILGIDDQCREDQQSTFTWKIQKI